MCIRYDRAPHQLTLTNLHLIMRGCRSYSGWGKGTLLEYTQLSKHPKYKETWQHSYGNEIGRLAQGMPGRVKGTNTIFFIKKSKVPQNRYKDVKYGCITCDYWERKTKPNQRRLKVGRKKSITLMIVKLWQQIYSLWNYSLTVSSLHAMPNLWLWTSTTSILTPHSKDMNISHSSWRT